MSTIVQIDSIRAGLEWIKSLGHYSRNHWSGISTHIEIISSFPSSCFLRTFTSHLNASLGSDLEENPKRLKTAEALRKNKWNWLKCFMTPVEVWQGKEHTAPWQRSVITLSTEIRSLDRQKTHFCEFPSSTCGYRASEYFKANEHKVFVHSIKRKSQ